MFNPTWIEELEFIDQDEEDLSTYEDVLDQYEDEEVPVYFKAY